MLDLLSRGKSTLSSVLIISTAVLSTAGFTSCTPRKDELAAVASFNTTVTKGIDATEQYFATYNDRQRKLYLAIVALNPECKVQYGGTNPTNCKALQNQNISLEPFLDTESIDIRLDLLNTLSKYSKALADLTTDSSPQDAKASIISVADSFKNIEKSFKEISAKDSPIADTFSTQDLAEKYVSPIAGIFASITEYFIDEGRWDAVNLSIIRNEKNINELLTFIEQDMNKLAPLDAATNQKRLVDLVNYYNSNKQKMSVAEREGMLAKIEGLAKIFESGVDPQTTPAEIKKVHLKLVKLAKANGSGLTVAELREALKEASSEIDSFVQSVKVLIAS